LRNGAGWDWLDGDAFSPEAVFSRASHRGNRARDSRHLRLRSRCAAAAHATPASLGDQGACLAYAQLLLALAMIDVVYHAARAFG